MYSSMKLHFSAAQGKGLKTFMPFLIKPPRGLATKVGNASRRR
jgi:hypothetical protein